MKEGTFSARLRSLRDGNGWNARLMSEKTGIPKQTLESYMSLKGAPSPGLDALKKMSIGLEVSLDWLVFGAEPVGEDVARLVRLCAHSAALPFLELIQDKLAKGEVVFSAEGHLLGLTPQEWAADIGWKAGDKAKALAGTTRPSLRVAERVFEQQIEAIFSARNPHSPKQS